MTTIADGSYLERMLAHLGERDPLEALADSASRVETVVRRLGSVGLQRAYGPGKWTGAQVLSHLADSELTIGFRVRQILTQQPHRVQEYDEAAWASLYKEVDAEAALGAFVATRRWNLLLFRSLGPQQLARVSFHPSRGEDTLAVLLRAFAGHTFNHLGQLESL